jgi:endonuclease III
MSVMGSDVIKMLVAASGNTISAIRIAAKDTHSFRINKRIDWAPHKKFKHEKMAGA